ncbi:MAG: reverse transcriptase family protein [Patescibacteria group bacterium]
MKKILLSKPSNLKTSTFSELLRILSISEADFDMLVATADSLYIQIRLKKKDGGTRIINAPSRKLKELQRSILMFILTKNRLQNCAYGCSKGKSIIENASAHIKSSFMINLDIKDFFPSVHYTKILQLYLDMGFSRDLAKKLCEITTLKYSLPQGAPTSPYLSNLVLQNLDKRLMLLSRKNRLIYTRYFDDITISGSNQAHKIKGTVEKIITAEGYKIKRSKVFIYNKGENKKVTGILIKPDRTLDLEDRDLLKKYLQDLKEKGLPALESSLIEKEKQSLRGKISFLKSVNNEEGEAFSRLFEEIKWEE